MPFNELFAYQSYDKTAAFMCTENEYSSSMNQEKLKLLQVQVRIGGKGTARRKNYLACAFIHPHFVKRIHM